MLPEYKDIKLEDYNGKKLIEGTLEEKAKYFNDYYSDKKSKDGGIVIENIFSCGAFPKDSVKKRNSSIDSILSKVSDEQNEYVWKLAKERKGRIINTYWFNPLDDECMDKLEKNYD